MITNKAYAREIESAFGVLSEVSKASGTKEKVNILKANGDNNALQTILYFAFNSFKQYYVKQLVSINPDGNDNNIEARFTQFICLLDSLSMRIFKDPKAEVAQFLSSCTAMEHVWYERVILRDLQLGITAKGVNQAYPGLIPTYEVQLAESVKDITLTDAKQLSRLPERFVIQYKIDGFRMNIHKFADGHVDIRTRSGLPVTGYTKLEEEASRLLVPDYVYDGEMVSPELFSWIEKNMLADNGGKIADRSLFTEAMRRCFAKGIGKDGIFNIFDMVSMGEWRTQQAKETYHARQAALYQCVGSIIDSGNASQMTVVPTSRIFYKNNPDDMKEVIRVFHKFLSWGWEGLMIKDVDAVYAWKRTKSLLKMKLMDTADLTVLSVIEAEGNGRGQVGKLVCDYNGVTMNIGTGRMTEAEKKLYLRDPNLIIGKTIEVAYQAVSTGKNGEPVLDFARYMKMRKDK